MNDLIKTKTFWTGIAAIVTGIGTYIAGEINTAAFMELLSIGLIGIFLRHGVAKK